ncbi:hypothetical protein AX15_002400 [Amanita polypyramis BW_CC]|nr:hypothetical protein AX15_002400 [Amanita polypyramis BW_CC]
MSLAKLTSVSTQTLSLLLERQRLWSLPSFASSDGAPARSASTHVPQIIKNLTQLRVGILQLKANEGRTEAVMLLRSQFERMKSMLGDEGNVESIDVEDASESTHVSSLDQGELPTTSIIDKSGRAPPESLLLKSSKEFASSAVYTPYTDDPEGEPDPNMMLQVQRQMIDEQDEHLDRLSHSINRQHHISVQINDELDVHAGLLEELDTDLDGTGSRLGSARRRLDRFAKGAKENSSAVMIALLIFVLLILIIVFKT